MSSACVCHIEGDFCFYCEIYSPLERKHEIQTGEIERVIAELELDQKIATIRIEEKMSDLSVGYWQAINDKCEEFINRLKEVLSDD